MDVSQRGSASGCGLPVGARPPFSSASPSADALWTSEGLSGVCQNELTSSVVRRAAAAFAAVLFAQTGGTRPRVVLANDGRPMTAELFASSAEAMLWAGCDVIELGVAGSSTVAATVRGQNAVGGLVIGNAPAEARTASISFFGANGLPWSLGGSLDLVRDLYCNGCTRPSRTAGRSERRTAIDPLPVEPLQRPLRIVLDTACGPVQDWLARHSAANGRFISPAPLPPAAPTFGKPGGARPSFRARREKMVIRQVIADAADFGLWIDGNSEACSVIDDRGMIVSPRTLLELLARCPWDETDIAVKYINHATQETLGRRALGERSALCGDALGRVWHCLPDAPPQFDSRLVLLGLMRLLVDSGQPLRKLLRSVDRLARS